MPLVRKIRCSGTGAPPVRNRVLRTRCDWSPGPFDRGAARRFAAAAAFAALVLFLPAPADAARLAGDEQPVATSPARPPAAAVKGAEPKASPAKPEKATPAATTAKPEAAAPAAQPSAVQARGAGAAPVAGRPSPSAVPVAAAPPLPPGPPVAGKPAPPGPPPPVAPPPPPPAPPVAEPRPPAAAVTDPKPAEAAPAPAKAAPAAPARYVTIDFDNVDISVFIKFVSELTGRNFVIDDKVRGKVTVISPKKIAVDEVYKVFSSVLEIYGFAAVEAGDVTKVIPALDARGKNLELRLQRGEIAPEDRVVTQILSLQHATPDEMKKVLDPLVSKTSVVLSYPPTGMLIITDVLSNIKRLQEIVTALDVEGVGELISYVPVKYASAVEVAKYLTAIFQRQAAPGRAPVSPIRIVADDRTNALIILAAENDTSRIRELLKMMDKEVPRGAGTIRVYYLQNAKAEDLVKVLTGLPQQQAKPAVTPGAPGGAAAAPAPPISKNVQIVADKSTNSLIITADTADYLIIEDVIRKLDITRPMVYLEGLIMEVNANKSFGVGVEWSALKDIGATGIGNDGSRNVGAIGFRGTPIIPQINSAGSFSMPSGFSLGVIGAGINISVGGTTLAFPNIGAVLQAFQNDSDVRILSTPQLLTLDNEDAEITVGQNVPYVTRQDTTVGSTTNYSNYEYKDVGVTLKVTPQINKEGFVRLKLDQSVTKLVSQSADVDAAGNRVLTPTTLKRTAKTTVVVKSGETVVIGGMIEDNSDEGISKVPGLGDVPLLGWLFKTKSRTNQRTNLFVFITPRVIEQPEEGRKIKDEKLDYMKTIQEGTIRTAPPKRPEAKEEAKPQEKEKEKE